MEDSVEEGQSINTCSQNITDVIKNNRVCVGIKGERGLNVWHAVCVKTNFSGKHP